MTKRLKILNLVETHKVRPVAVFLKNARLKAGLSQREVAESLGYQTVQFISNWERGLKTPPGTTFLHLVKLYKITAESIYEVLLQDKIAEAKRELKQMLSLDKRGK